MTITFDVPDLKYAREIAELILSAAAEHDFKATEAAEQAQKVQLRRLSPGRTESLCRLYWRRHDEYSQKAEELHQIYKAIRKQIRKLEAAALI